MPWLNILPYTTIGRRPRQSQPGQLNTYREASQATRAIVEQDEYQQLAQRRPRACSLQSRRRRNLNRHNNPIANYNKTAPIDAVHPDSKCAPSVIPRLQPTHAGVAVSRPPPENTAAYPRFPTGRPRRTQRQGHIRVGQRALHFTNYPPTTRVLRAPAPVPHYLLGPPPTARRRRLRGAALSVSGPQQTPSSPVQRHQYPPNSYPTRDGYSQSAEAGRPARLHTRKAPHAADTSRRHTWRYTSVSPAATGVNLLGRHSDLSRRATSNSLGRLLAARPPRRIRCSPPRANNHNPQRRWGQSSPTVFKPAKLRSATQPVPTTHFLCRPPATPRISSANNRPVSTNHRLRPRRRRRRRSLAFRATTAYTTTRRPRRPRLRRSQSRRARGIAAWSVSSEDPGLEHPEHQPPGPCAVRLWNRAHSRPTRCLPRRYLWTPSASATAGSRGDPRQAQAGGPGPHSG